MGTVTFRTVVIGTVTFARRRLQPGTAARKVPVPGGDPLKDEQE